MGVWVSDDPGASVRASAWWCRAHSNVLKPCCAQATPAIRLSTRNDLRSRFWLGVVSVWLVLPTTGCQQHPHLAPHPRVPAELRVTTLEPSPNGQSEAERYVDGYVRLWCDCVRKRGEDLHARCDVACNGTAGAAAGCAAGSIDADNGIDRLVANRGAEAASTYLRTLTTRDARCGEVGQEPGTAQSSGRPPRQ